MTTTQPIFYRERPYLAVSMTHFFVDILNSSRNLVVAIIAISLGLTNAQVGITLLLYNVGGSLSQPFFGWLALLVRDLRRRISASIWHVALAVALLSYLIHGFLDYFLLFNGTGLLFWLLVGLWVSLRAADDDGVTLVSGDHN